MEILAMGYLNLAAETIKYGIEVRSKYLKHAHENLARAQRDVKEQYETAKQESPDADEPDIWDHYEDIWHDLNEDFPNQLYSAFLVSWYSFVETRLKELCRDLEQRDKLQLSLAEINGDGILNYWKYIEIVADICVNDGHWDELANITRLRNKIVHDGKISLRGKGRKEGQKALREYLDKSQLDVHKRYLNGKQFWTVNITIQYCRHLVTFGKEFLADLFIAAGYLDEKHRRRITR